MPQPIDMQTELGRTIMADRIQDAMSRANLAALQRAQLDEEEDRIAKESEVHEAPETQSEHVDEELKRKTPYVGRRRRGRKGEEDDETGSESARRRNSDGEDHILDVKV